MKHKFGKTKFTLDVIKITKDNSEKEGYFVFFATTIFLHHNEDAALRILDEIYRTRGQTEDAFKVQKHHGVKLKAAFGTRGYARQNYYLIVQITDIIRTLMLLSSLFMRLLQHANNEDIPKVLQRPILNLYGTIVHFIDKFRSANRTRKLTEIDMGG